MVSLQQRLLPRNRHAPPPPRQAGRLGQRRLHVAQDRPLGAGGHDRLGEAVHVDVGAAAIAALGPL